ncbi:uncharacterized protein [Oscarella lobularis]|uniref:uncharacterized protein n=1 Tax=Oscarella lobularis TaxID=121494 RepID=UPI00331442A1
MDVVKWLCDRGFQLSKANSAKKNVFHALAESNQKGESDRIYLLVWLAKPPAEIDEAVNERRWTRWAPLSLACCSNNFKFAKKLLELGAQQRINIKTGSALLRQVIENEELGVAKAIAELKVKFSGLRGLSRNAVANFRNRKVFDSFVAKGLLIAGMPCVFHWAAWYGSALSLNHLLRHKANLEEKDDEGYTPIMCCSSLENMQWFVQHGANYHVVDKKGNSLLHLYGTHIYSCHSISILWSVRISVLQYLLNIDLSLETENNDKMKPHEIAEGEMQIFLKAKYTQMLSFRLDSERVQPECVQTCLVGEPMAGKTTLTNSLCGITSQSDDRQSDELDRTAGVDVHNKQVDGVGLMSIWDFGGHYPFRVAHAVLFCFALTIFLCVVDIVGENGKRRAMKEVIAELRRWLAFLKSARKSIVSGITIVVVGNKRTGGNRDDDMKQNLKQNLCRSVAPFFLTSMLAS